MSELEVRSVLSRWKVEIQISFLEIRDSEFLRGHDVSPSLGVRGTSAFDERERFIDEMVRRSLGDEVVCDRFDRQSMSDGGDRLSLSSEPSVRLDASRENDSSLVEVASSVHQYAVDRDRDAVLNGGEAEEQTFLFERDRFEMSSAGTERSADEGIAFKDVLADQIARSVGEDRYPLVPDASCTAQIGRVEPSLLIDEKVIVEYAPL
jgi:hypothetical protein